MLSRPQRRSSATSREGGPPIRARSRHRQRHTELSKRAPNNIPSHELLKKATAEPDTSKRARGIERLVDLPDNSRDRQLQSGMPKTSRATDRGGNLWFVRSGCRAHEYDGGNRAK